MRESCLTHLPLASPPYAGRLGKEEMFDAGTWATCMYILPTRIHNKRVALARKEKRGCVTHPFTFGRIPRRRALHAHRGPWRDAYPPIQESPCKLPSSSLPLLYTQQYTEHREIEKPLTFFGLIVKLSVPRLQILAFLCFEKVPGRPYYDPRAFWAHFGTPGTLKSSLLSSGLRVNKITRLLREKLKLHKSGKI